MTLQVAGIIPSMVIVDLHYSPHFKTERYIVPMRFRSTSLVFTV